MTAPEQYRSEIETNLKWLIGGAVNNYAVGVMTQVTFKLNAYDLTEAIGCIAIEVNEYLKLLDKDDNKVMTECIGLLGKLEYSVAWADDIQDRFKYKWSTAIYCTKTIVKLAENRLSKGNIRSGVYEALKALIRELEKYRDVHTHDHNSFVRHIQEHKSQFDLNDQLNSILDKTNKREG